MLAETMRGVKAPVSVIVGWSLGASLALEACRQRLLSPRRLVLVGGTPSLASRAEFSWGVSRARLRAMIAMLVSSPTSVLDAFVRMCLSGSELDAPNASQWLGTLRNAAGRTNPAVLAATLSGYAETDLTKCVQHVGIPTCVVHGDSDAVIPMGAARWLVASLPNASLVELAGAGHAAVLTRVDEVAAAIVDSISAAEQQG